MLFRFFRFILFISAILLSLRGATASEIAQDSLSEKTVSQPSPSGSYSIQEQVSFLNTIKNNEYAFARGSSEELDSLPENSETARVEGCNLSSTSSSNIPFFTFWLTLVLYVTWLRSRRKL